MRLAMATLVLAACVTCVVGCPSGPCAPATKGAQSSRCVEIVCPKAAHIESGSGACACASGSTAIVGACVPYKLADTFCGSAATPQSGGSCLRKKCSPGEAVDLDHGLCLPEAAARATLLHGPPTHGEDDDKRRASCLFGALVSHGLANQLSCAIGAQSCRRGEHFVKGTSDAGATLTGTCEPTPACSAGEIFDEPSSTCVRVVHAGEDAFLVDVGAWARLALGTDGAEGTNAFCAPVRASGAQGRFQIELSFLNNDITQASGRLSARPGTMPNTSDAAERSLEQLIDALHYYGGTASAAAVSLDVSCTPAMPASPTLEVPKVDGDGGR